MPVDAPHRELQRIQTRTGPALVLPAPDSSQPKESADVVVALLLAIVVGSVLLFREEEAPPPQLEFGRLTRAVVEDGVRSVWGIDGEAGQTVSIQVESDDFDTLLRLLQPSGTAMTSNDDRDSNNARLVTVLPADGLYGVEIVPRGGLTSGAYTVRVDAEDVRDLESDTGAGGILASDDRLDVWSLQGSAGQAVRLEAESPDFDTVLRLLTEGGEELARDDDGGTDGNSRIEAILPTDGRFFAEVAAFGPLGTGRYEVRVVSSTADSTAGAQVLRVGSTVRGTLNEESVGVWTLSGSAGRIVAVDARSSTFDAVLRLLNARSEEIAYDDDGGEGTDSRIEAILPEDGEYLVEVSAYDAQETGIYEVQVNNAATSNLERDRDLSGSLGLAERGFWRLSGIGGEVVSVEVRSDAFVTALRLLDSRGEELAYSDNVDGEGNSRVTAVLASDDAAYIVEVTAIGASDDGTYVIHARDLDVPELEWSRQDTGFLDGGGVGVWKLNVSAQQEVVAEAQSEEFDTTLRLRDSSGAELAYDDDGGDGTNSRIRAVVPGGVLLVEVKAYFSQSEGNYEVLVMQLPAPTRRTDEPN